VLVYDARVLLTYLLAVGVALVVLIMLAFVNPFYALLSVLLFLPAWLLVKVSYAKWDMQDQPWF
jgi:ABC-type transport system involved in cytochrome bd biosynthesis fused ATPase/permease subunit